MTGNFAYETVLSDLDDDGVRTITLNRPEKRNAFNAEVLCRLCDAWDLLDADPELRVGIMTGSDGNFSAGADLDRLVGALTSGKPAEDEYEERIRQEHPTIAEVHVHTEP